MTWLLVTYSPKIFVPEKPSSLRMFMIIPSVSNPERFSSYTQHHSRKTTLSYFYAMKDQTKFEEDAMVIEPLSSVIIEPYSTMDEMWKKVLRDARTTVGKFETGNIPSQQFKESILKSRHSPIRGLIFEVFLNSIPYHITQQFSHHHIALETSPNMQFCEEINPTDMEHFIQTSREDRTGRPRSERRQTDPVQYRFRANAQGLIDASHKRLCLAADKDAVRFWSAVK